MEDPLLAYYERELTFIRESGALFAEKYPKIAGRLLLEPDRCEDPHTERLLEGFAFLTARIQKKLDDSFPELTESLLQIIYPHYTRPLPSITTVKFKPLLVNVPPSGHLLARGTTLLAPPVNDAKIEFRTTQAVRLLPAEVTGAGFTQPYDPGIGADGGIKIEIATAGQMPLGRIEWPDTLRFFLNGHPQHVFRLYEWIMNNAVEVRLVSFAESSGILCKQDSVRLGPEHISAVGFGEGEGLLPWPRQSFDGFRLLYEYFAFPEKFLYFDLGGTDQLRRMAGDRFEINIYLNQTGAQRLLIDNDTFCLFATPAVNLFERIALPIRVAHRKTQYPLRHDNHTNVTTEVFTVDRVVGIADKADGQGEVVYHPFYAVSHPGPEEDEAYWHLRRHASPRKGDKGMDAVLAFTDIGLEDRQPRCATLTVHTTCTNRDLPVRLAPGGSGQDFFLASEAPVTGITCLMKPTPPLRPQPGSRMQWRLISHLSLNYLSLLAEDGQGLKELLKLYDMHDSPVTRQQIEGIEAVTYSHETMRLGRAFCRGVEVTVTFNEDKFVGSSAYLFGCVLERFLAQYVSINAFTRLVVKSMQRTGVMKAWPARNGNRILI